MKRLFLVGTTVVALTAYVFTRKLKREALLDCFNMDMSNREGKDNNSLITLNLKWNFSFGGSKRHT